MVTITTWRIKLTSANFTKILENIFLLQLKLFFNFYSCLKKGQNWFKYSYNEFWAPSVYANNGIEFMIKIEIGEYVQLKEVNQSDNEGWLYFQKLIKLNDLTPFVIFSQEFWFFEFVSFLRNRNIRETRFHKKCKKDWEFSKNLIDS